MNDCNLIFNSNKTEPCTICFDKNILTVKLKKKYIDGSEIMKTVRHINEALRKYKNTNFDIIIDIGDGNFLDKLAYIILECIVYSIIVDFKKRICVTYGKRGDKAEISSDGFIYSPIHFLKKTPGKSLDIRCNDFLVAFDKKTILQRHYRNIVKFPHNADSNIFSLVQHEIRTFLNVFLQNEEQSKEIAEVACELLMNASEHTQTDCLIDIDVTADKNKVGDSVDVIYKGVNIAIINFSNKLFGDALRQKMKSDVWHGLSKYDGIKDVYNNHKKLFDANYDEEDFYNIASLQDKISGRLNSSATGGTGLTQLIRSAEKRSDSHYCYLLSGDKVVNFNPNFLKSNNGWIGFNDKNDFANCRPDTSAISCCELFMPGTAFNLNFVMKKN